VRVLVAAGAVLVALPAAADSSVDEWVETVAQEYRAFALREARGAGTNGDAAVAIVCAAHADDEECTMLAHRLAQRLERARAVVVTPRRDFATLSSWDHVGCGADAAERLGWHVIELRGTVMRWRVRSRFSAVAPDGVLLHGDWVRLEEADYRAARSWSAPFEVTARRSSEPEVAAYLAHRLACALKELPEKRLLKTELAGKLRSPHEAAWLHRVGERVTDHLNRVIRSSFHAGPGWVLEMSIDARGAATSVIARVRPESGAEPRVEGGPAEQRCPIELDRRLDPRLGDLRWFADDLEAARGYLRRAGLAMETLQVANEVLPGTIVGQTPPPETRPRDVAARRVTVMVSGPSPPAGARPSTSDARTRLVRIANHLQIPGEAWSECLDIFGRSDEERRAFATLLERYDPRSPDSSPLQLWQAWYEFAHPAHEPYFPDSPANRFAREVADRLYADVEDLLFERGGDR
jgi:hypothetical protein